MTYLQWIKAGLEKPGKTQAGLARALGIAQPGVSRLLNGQRQLKADEIPKVEAYLGLPPPPAETAAALEPNARPAPDAPPLALTSMPKDVPVLGTAAGGTETDFTLNGEVIDYVRRPPGIANARSVFAIYTVGDSMSPWREPGEPVYVNPGRDPRIGDHVVVELRAGRSEEPGGALLKKLVGRNKAELRLAQYNPHKDDIVIPIERIRRVFRVIPWEELLGV